MPSKFETDKVIWVAEGIWEDKNDGTVNLKPLILQAGEVLIKLGEVELLTEQEGLAPKICMSLGNTIWILESIKSKVVVVNDISMVKALETPVISPEIDTDDKEFGEGVIERVPSEIRKLFLEILTETVLADESILFFTYSPVISTSAPSAI